MLREVRPDFVDVATTVETHRPLVELALAHGAATVCQKPFAETYADGLRHGRGGRARRGGR
jgi:D-apiose dehydrogenase